MSRTALSNRWQLLTVVMVMFAGLGLSAFAAATTSSAAVPKGWSAPTSFDPPHGGQTSISCSSSTFCAEVDTNGNAFTFNGTGWSAPVRIDNTSLGERFPVLLNAISCASASFCAAVDDVGNALIYNGSTWSAPHDIDGDERLSSVSCPTSTFCAAVDRDGSVTTYNGSAWSLPTLVDAGDAGGAREVSCTSSSFCAIVSPSAAVTYNGSTWSSITAIGIGPTVYGLSCASPSFCVAEGDNGFSGPGTTIYNGSSWSAVSGNGGGHSVSCPTSSFCVAVNGSTYSIYNGASWTSPAALAFNLVSVSCASATYCGAAGVDNPVMVGSSEVTDDGAVFTYQGSTWSAATAVDPHGGGPGGVSCATTDLCVAVADGMDASIDNSGTWTFNSYVDNDDVTLAAVSCPTSTFCMAVNSAGDALTFNGSTWSAPTAIDANRGLSAVSCSSSSSCIAVDDTGEYLSYNGGGWTLPATIDGSGDGLTSVSCPTSTFCAALDFDGDALTYNGAIWTSPTTAIGTGAANAVSCTSATFCVAVGGSGASTYRGSSWSAPTTVTQSIYTLADVSCTSPTFCTGVDTSGLAQVYNGSAWSAGQHLATAGRVESVSCVSSTFCVATDDLGNAYTYGGPLPLPTRTVGPTISGTPRVGHTLTCHVSYNGATSVTYHWTRNGKTVGKAVASYPLKAPDLHAKIACVTQAGNAGGHTAQVASGSVTVKLGSPLTNHTAPKVAGPAKVGHKVRAKAGSWAPAATSFTYSWRVGKHGVRHATGKTFTIPATDKGKRLSVRVTAHRAGYANGTATSKAVKVT